MVTKQLPVLTVDLGGTKILTALLLGSKILYKDYSTTDAAGGVNTVIRRINDSITRVLKCTERGLSQIQSISIAAAGAIDTKNGIVTLSPNLPDWRDVPLVKMIMKKYPVNTYLVHDAGAAALGEHHYGAGQGLQNLIFLTVSTGIGGGIIINNKLYEGAAGAAGEIGHMTIDINGPKCPCGNTGCLEMLASGTAMAREAIRLINKGEKSLLEDIVQGKIDNITAKDILLAVEKNDTLAISVLNWTAINLGVGLVNLVNIFNPEIIIIGGGISNFGEYLLSPARHVVKECAFPFPAKIVKIVKAKLGEDAGIIGAEVFAREQK
jgi:glucokinase